MSPYNRSFWNPSRPRMGRGSDLPISGKVCIDENYFSISRGITLDDGYNPLLLANLLNPRPTCHQSYNDIRTASPSRKDLMGCRTQVQPSGTGRIWGRGPPGRCRGKSRLDV